MVIIIIILMTLTLNNNDNSKCLLIKLTATGYKLESLGRELGRVAILVM